MAALDSQAQTPAPVPQAGPTPSPQAQPAPTPGPAPHAAPAPNPLGAPADAVYLSPQTQEEINELARQAAEQAREVQNRLPELEQQAREAAAQVQVEVNAAQIADQVRSQIDVNELAREAQEQVRELQGRLPDFEKDARAQERALAAEERAAAKAQADAFRFDRNPNLGALFAQKMGSAQRRFANEDRLYEAGKRSLDNHRWDDALEEFNQVVSGAGARADAALYWKAYTLNKLGRRDEALAALADLRKTYPSSRWLDDAKVLELEVQQASGKPVSPDQQADEDLKLIAINSIMQSDPDRAIPLLENLLKTSTSPKLKERAIYVLAQSGSPRAHQILERIARGGGNPDLQVKAIEYMRQWRHQSGDNQPDLLPEIYASTTDVSVKRAILDTYSAYREWDHLLQAARTEKNHDLYLRAIQSLGNHAGQPELWQLYQSATSPDDKAQILECMYNSPDANRLAEALRNEKDSKVREAAVNALAYGNGGAISADTLVAVYNSEQDEKIKQHIVDGLANRRDAKALVELARAEKDPKMKLQIVDRLGRMKSKEASDYLLELLSK
jgi:TolA-binding protein